MSAPFLRTYSQAARELGVAHNTVTDLVRSLGIPQRPHPHSGNGKALDEADMAKLRKALGREVVPISA